MIIHRSLPFHDDGRSRTGQHDNVIQVSLHTEDARLPDEATVSGEVVSPGGVRMDYRFAVTARGDGGSLVADRLRLHAPFGLLHYRVSRQP